MRHLEILVEERSATVFLSGLLPRFELGDATWEIREFSGKNDLLRSLPSRLQGYKSLANSLDLRVLVLVDQDNDDCKRLKLEMEDAAAAAGLPTKSSSADFVVVNRIVVEELEAWYFGDVPALRQVFPRIPESLPKKAKYRNPDAITGGTWETLEKLVQRYGYERGGLRKVAVAAAVAEHIDIATNTSASFQTFAEGLRAAAS